MAKTENSPAIRYRNIGILPRTKCAGSEQRGNSVGGTKNPQIHPQIKSGTSFAGKD